MEKHFYRREFKDVLRDKYPHLIGSKSPIEAWGIETEEGWDNIVMAFIVEIDKYIKDNDLKDFYILQIKQKFGQLRIYYSTSTRFGDHFSKLNDLLKKYEKLASETCEVCGESGCLKTIGSWMTVRCEKHAKQSI